MNKALYSVLAIILVLAIAGASFYGGMLFGKTQAQSTAAAQRAAFFQGGGLPAGAVPLGGEGQGQTGGFSGQGQGSFRQRNGNFTFGTIKQIGDGTLVIADNNGKETQVKVTDTTLVEKNQTVKLTDLSQGETVIVSGQAAADGTITARSVQVAPQGRLGFGGSGAQGQGVNAQATPSR